MKVLGKFLLFLGAMSSIATWAGESRLTLTVGSKNFNENYVLAEIASQLLESRGFEIERKFGLGGTLICFGALVSGEIDAYVEYTGTLSEVILGDDTANTPGAINQSLKIQNLEILPSLGFNNTYAIVLRREMAQARGIHSISQLSTQQNLKLAFSHEFLRRADGWPGLQRAYGIRLAARGIEHGLAYQALADGSIDVTDAYSTDGELRRYNLKMLKDDKSYFPQYLAVPLVRKDLPARARAALVLLGGTINETTMQSMNESVVFEGLSFSEVAKRFLSSHVDLLSETAQQEALPPSEDSENVAQESELFSSIFRNTLVHLKLTGIALLLSVSVGLLLSLLVYRITWLSRTLIYISGLLQTIPSIALLALMIPIFGIGELPAIVALFFYSLLPVIRNTVTALVHVDPLLKRVALAIGLRASERLRIVYLPLALPNILAGVRTATVISIGTATLAAFIGAGGLGDPIVTGLALNDTNLILQGAIPAALLALMAELLFEFIEYLFVSRHFDHTHSS